MCPFELWMMRFFFLDWSEWWDWEFEIGRYLFVISQYFFEKKLKGQTVTTWNYKRNLTRNLPLKGGDVLEAFMYSVYGYSSIEAELWVAYGGWGEHKILDFDTYLYFVMLFQWWKGWSMTNLTCMSMLTCLPKWVNYCGISGS